MIAPGLTRAPSQQCRREWIEKQIYYFSRSRRGKKGESESVTRRMKLEKKGEFGWRCAWEVALQLTN